MAKTTKRLLGVSLGCLALGLVFATGAINVETFSGAYVALPLGAVLFGLFLISKLLEKESALYDAEQEAHPACSKASKKAATKDCGCAAKAEGRV